MSVLSELNLGRRKQLPVIVGAEAAECGLACLAMIGRYHGHDIDLNSLRQRYSLSLAGASLRSLMTLADQLSLAPRALRVELEALHKVSTPAILHWDLNHFVVLKSVGPKAATIHDPARGARTLKLEEFSKHFTGVVLELTPSTEFQRVKDRRLVRLDSLWSKATGLWSGAAQVLVLSLALQIVAFAAPFQIQLVVDDAIGRGDSSFLTVVALGFGALAVLQALLEALRGWALLVFGNMFTFQLVGNLVRHLLRLPSAFFEKRHIGDILSRLNSTTAVQDALTKGLVSALVDGAIAVVAAIILFVYSPLLTSITVAAVLLNLALTLTAYPMMRARAQEQLIASARERSHLMESVRAATTIKLMGREAERESNWRNLYVNVINSTVSVGKFQIGVGFIQSAITGVTTVLILYAGASTILAGGFSVGMLLTFVSLRQTFGERTTSLINQALQFRLLGLHLERLGDIVTASPEARSTVPTRVDVEGAISLRGVGFRYGSTDPMVLKDVNLEIRPGDFLAITGTSGGGKSTLLKLLLGLHEPVEGTIELDGLAATPELWRTWRARFGVVAQDDRLLSGSIADNIAFFDPDLDMHRVQKAAVAAQVHADIVRMPMQYQSLIGDMGSSLSGGQRQRVLLARALYRDPSILILDEGTANLDDATEAVIADLIAELSITRIVVAHRPALIGRAHKVVSVQDGTLRDLEAHEPVVSPKPKPKRPAAGKASSIG